MQQWQNRHKVVPAVYILLRKDNQILFLKRKNTGYCDDFFSLPAGHLDGGEPAVVAAAREAKEEVGVDVRPQDLHLVYTQHRVAESGDHERMNLYFETKKWRGTPVNAEPDKCSEIRWAPMDEPPDELIPELGHLFRHLTQNTPYGHFGFD